MGIAITAFVHASYAFLLRNVFIVFLLEVTVVPQVQSVTHAAGSSLVRRESRSSEDSPEERTLAVEGDASSLSSSVPDRDSNPLPPLVELEQRHRKTGTKIDGRDCEHLPDGYAMVQPGSGEPFMVLCEHGWVLAQKRTSFNEHDGNFAKNWASYKQGWGGRDNLWLGLDKLHRLTDPAGELKIKLYDESNHTKYAHYTNFSIKGSSDKYKMFISGYTSSSAIADSLSYHSGSKFSTTDQDNDHHSGHCANDQGGRGGWWYKAQNTANSCADANLNGKYYPAGQISTFTEKRDGICWKSTSWHHDTSCAYSYGQTYMMVKAGASRRRYVVRKCAHGFTATQTFCWDETSRAKKLCGIQCTVTPIQHIS